MPAILGMNAKAYWKAGGVAGGGSWTELVNMKDVSLSMEAAQADVTVRGNNGWRAYVQTLREASVEFQMIWDHADAGFNAMKDAFLNNEVIGLKILDASEASGAGLVADFMVMNFSRNESLEEAITASVTCKLTYSNTPPEWVEGS